jgi:hypothetical protein
MNARDIKHIAQDFITTCLHILRVLSKSEQSNSNFHECTQVIGHSDQG